MFAEGGAAPVYRVESSPIVSGYTPRIRFEDATEQVVEFRPILEGESCGPRRDLELFNQVRIDPEVDGGEPPDGGASGAGLRPALTLP
jgi:hypothetical protein